MFTSSLDLIRRYVRHIGSRRHLNAQDVEEFEAEVHLKLIDDDYAVLRCFEGRSTLSTYLHTVILRAFRDFQTKRWGKWRPSAAARRQGQQAVELERLMHLEGQSFEAACAALSSSQGRPVDIAQLARIAASFPARQAKRAAGAEILLELPARGGEPEAALRERERAETARRAERLLGEAIERLSPEDRMMIRLSYVEGVTVAGIAAALGLEQRPLYRAMERCLRDMRAYLEEHGLKPAEVADLLGAPGVFLEVPGLKAKRGESPGRRPSNRSKPNSGGPSREGGGLDE